MSYFAWIILGFTIGFISGRVLTRRDRAGILDFIVYDFDSITMGTCELKTDARCPACGWTDVRLSRPHGVLDRVARVLHRVPYRCRTCGHRFYSPHPASRVAGASTHST